MVDEFVEAIPPVNHHVRVHDLKKELPSLLAAAQDVNIDHDDVSGFSDSVLDFWRNASKKHL